MKNLAICILIGALFSGYALAQTVNASLGGTVADSSGAVVPKATITATGIDTGVTTKAVTNNSGVYEGFPVSRKATTGFPRRWPGLRSSSTNASRSTSARR